MDYGGGTGISAKSGRALASPRVHQPPCLLFAYPGLPQNRLALRHSVRTGRTEVVEVVSDLRSGTLVRALPEWAGSATPIQAVCFQRDPVPRRIGAFVDLLAEQ